MWRVEAARGFNTSFLLTTKGMKMTGKLPQTYLLRFLFYTLCYYRLLIQSTVFPPAFVAALLSECSSREEWGLLWTRKAWSSSKEPLWTSPRSWSAPPSSCSRILKPITAAPVAAPSLSNYDLATTSLDTLVCVQNTIKYQTILNIMDCTYWFSRCEPIELNQRPGYIFMNVLFCRQWVSLLIDSWVADIRLLIIMHSNQYKRWNELLGFPWV